MVTGTPTQQQQQYGLISPHSIHTSLYRCCCRYYVHIMIYDGLWWWIGSKSCELMYIVKSPLPGRIVYLGTRWAAVSTWKDVIRAPVPCRWIAPASMYATITVHGKRSPAVRPWTTRLSTKLSLGTSPQPARVTGVIEISCDLCSYCHLSDPFEWIMSCSPFALRWTRSCGSSLLKCLIVQTIVYTTMQKMNR